MDTVNPRELFDWYPIERLERIEPDDAVEDIRGMGRPDVLRRDREWQAIVRRNLGVDPWTREILWSPEEAVDLAGVTSEMARRNGDGAIFHVYSDEPNPQARVMAEINAAAEAIAARVQPTSRYDQLLAPDRLR